MIETVVELEGQLNNDIKIIDAEPKVENGVLEFVINANVEEEELVL